MKIKPWKKVKEKSCFKKYSREIIAVDFELPNKKVADYYLINQGRAVATLALTQDEKILLVEQYRPGPDEVLLELPGGVVEEGESPEKAGLRELLEETGYSGEAVHIVDVFDDAYSTMNRSCVLVKNCKKIKEQNLDENEFINVVEMPIKEFRNFIRKGKMTDIEVAYLALDYLGKL